MKEEEIVVAKGFLRNYYGGKEDRPCKCCPESAEGHACYRAMLHCETPGSELIDKCIDVNDAVWQTMCRFQEGERVEIVIRRMGEKSPLADEPWVLLEPHHYGKKAKKK